MIQCVDDNLLRHATHATLAAPFAKYTAARLLSDNDIDQHLQRLLSRTARAFTKPAPPTPGQLATSSGKRKASQLDPTP